MPLPPRKRPGPPGDTRAVGAEAPAHAQGQSASADENTPQLTHGIPLSVPRFFLVPDNSFNFHKNEQMRKNSHNNFEKENGNFGIFIMNMYFKAIALKLGGLAEK